MRAVVHERYGPPEVLRVAEVERPVPKDDEVLVQVHASTVTRGDAMGVRSREYRFTRLFTGIRRPRRTSHGTEFAGRVVEIGSAVTVLRVGDEVFGIEGGANAEYVLRPAFGRDGHYLFSDPAGARAWVPAVEDFLARHRIAFEAPRPAI